jgi:hypothetical protein
MDSNAPCVTCDKLPTQGLGGDQHFFRKVEDISCWRWGRFDVGIHKLCDVRSELSMMFAMRIHGQKEQCEDNWT